MKPAATWPQQLKHTSRKVQAFEFVMVLSEENAPFIVEYCCKAVLGALLDQWDHGKPSPSTPGKELGFSSRHLVLTLFRIHAEVGPAYQASSFVTGAEETISTVCDYLCRQVISFATEAAAVVPQDAKILKLLNNTSCRHLELEESFAAKLAVRSPASEEDDR